MKRRTEITIEKRRVILMSRGGTSVTKHCEECGLTVRMVSVDLAAALTGLSARNIYRRVESGEVHYAELPDGLLLICVASVRAA